MTEDVVCNLVELYNTFNRNSVMLSISTSAARSLAEIYDNGGGEAMQAAIYRTFDMLMRENTPDTMRTLRLRFFRNDTHFYYFALAKQTESGLHVEILFKDDTLRQRFSDV